MMKILKIIACISLLFAAHASAAAIEGVGHISRVVDGDTMVVRVSHDQTFQQFIAAAQGNDRRMRYINRRDQTIRVRLGSVDTAESVHANPNRNSAEGARVSQIVKRMLDRQPVSFQCYDFGRYGRSICNIGFNLNGRPTDLGAWLIANGYSRYVTAWGRNPYMDAQYRQAEAHADSNL